MTTIAPGDDDDAVWYACYGSNLSLARFRCYLEGGRPAGATQRQPGCRDAGAPSGDRPVALPGHVRFGRHAPSWGGAVAFFDLQPDFDLQPSGRWPGRAYRLTAGQLADVVAQENRLAPGSVNLDVGVVVADRTRQVCSGWYGTVVHVGDVDGEPLLTITGDAGDPRPPTASYLETIAIGLAESHRLDPRGIAAHLLRCPGVSPTWTRPALEALCPSTPT